MASETIYQCAYCPRLFPTFAQAKAHEGRSHEGNASPVRRINKHRKMTEKCEHCGEVHTLGQHQSHGPGSFARTHGGAAPRRSPRKASAPKAPKKGEGRRKVSELEKLQRMLAKGGFSGY